MKSFSDKVLDIVRHIKRGQTLTYKQVAKKAGNEKASRAVGTIMAHNFRPDVPCHRVIRSDGTIGNYNRGGTLAKKRLLRTEGALA